MMQNFKIIFTQNIILVRVAIINVILCYVSVVNDDTRRRHTSLKENFAKLVPKAKEKIRKGCTKKLLFKRLPFLRWLPNYSVPDGVGDLVAGITVGLTVIPQALAYSNIAGLDPQVQANSNRFLLTNFYDQNFSC